MTAVRAAERSRAPRDGEWEYLLRTWRGLNVPEGWRAEIDEGQIALVPPPHRHHHATAEALQYSLYAELPAELGIYQALGVHIAPLGKLLLPDLVVLPRVLVAAEDAEDNAPFEAADARLLVEITSGTTARTDRTRKLWAYAHAQVPLYLLVDRFDERGPMVTLYSDPQDGMYKRAQGVPFGQPLTLPDPFHATLPTEKFPH
ncbi:MULTISPECIES: Uma2 family endonuclease [Streptomyces]|nr:Uma2 family endonuclease [Streptomyces sp. SCSIO ZS0520]AYN34626.1 hypothetical protein DUI70_4127 [Streptomyces albus]